MTYEEAQSLYRSRLARELDLSSQKESPDNDRKLSEASRLTNEALREMADACPAMVVGR